MPSQLLTGWYPYPDKSGNFQECTGWDNILREIFILLITRPGTRQWNPEFGCRLLDMLFEINLSEEDFVNVITNAFQKWLPHINLKSCECKISRQKDRYGLKADITMKIEYDGETKNVKFNVPSQMDLNNGIIHNISVTRVEELN